MQALYYTLVLERVCASFVVHSSTGTCLCKLCSTQSYWEVLRPSFVVHSSTGNALCKLCST